MDITCREVLDSLRPNQTVTLPRRLVTLQQITDHAHNHAPAWVYSTSEFTVGGEVFHTITRIDRYKTQGSTRFEIAKLLATLNPGDSVTYKPSKPVLPTSIASMVSTLVRSHHLPGRYRTSYNTKRDEFTILRNY